ncbi:MAG: hypothetical protein KC656_25490, partial [Myxococcales bacterium]|nr:hypothetical protein [Myxococcales bacterium]
RKEMPERTLALVARDGELVSPTVGGVVWRAPEGTQLQEGRLVAVLDRAGQRLGLVVPAGVAGVSVGVPGDWLEADQRVCEVGAGGAVEAGSASGPVDTGLPEGVVAVRADTDGTFYASPEPGKPAFAPVGTAVEARQTLGLVEVMKTFSAVRAPVAGTVERVVAADGGPVSAGDVIFWVRP